MQLSFQRGMPLAVLVPKGPADLEGIVNDARDKRAQRRQSRYLDRPSHRFKMDELVPDFGVEATQPDKLGICDTNHAPRPTITGGVRLAREFYQLRQVQKPRLRRPAHALCSRRFKIVHPLLGVLVGYDAERACGRNQVAD